MRTRYIYHPLHLECSTSLYSAAVNRMPAFLSGLVFSILASNALTFGLAGSAFAISAISYGLVAAAAIGLQLATAKKPSTPQPSDVQANIRQPISPRRRIYGRYLTGSVIVFGFRRGDKSYILHYIGEGPIKQYVSFRLDKKPVTLNENGYVTQDQYRYDAGSGTSKVQILSTLGLMTDEPFQAILDAFPELDDPLKPFRHRGCAMVLQIVEQVRAEDMQDVYPNNMPNLQVLIDGLDNTYDPRTDDEAFTDNAGVCLLTECMDVYGYTSADVDDVDFDAFAAFADHCDEDVSLKAGGAEKRYRSAGVIYMNAENEDRIKSIASVCNADVFIDRQGRLSVRQKLRSTPSIALRAKNGDHLSVQLEGGRTEQKKFNMIKVSYLDPGLNYKENEVTWRKEDWIEDDGGELVGTLTATMCPSSTQAQRLGALALYEQNPDYVGSLTSGPQALELIEDYCFTLDLSPEDDFERVACATGEIEYDADQASVSTSISIFAEGATDWTPATDEQDQVEIPPVLLAHVDDVTLDVTVTVELMENSAPVLKFSWVAADDGTLPESYSQRVQVSAFGANDWHDATVNQEQHTALYSPVADGGLYSWQIRNIAGGKTFDWQSSTIPVTVVIDTTAPLGLDDPTAANGTGQFFAQFNTLNDSHLSTVAIYKVASGGTLDRETDAVGPRYGVSLGLGYSLLVTSVAGNFDIYMEPFNRSSIAGPLAGPFAVTVS
jgi:hypothetical protein